MAQRSALQRTPPIAAIAVGLGGGIGAHAGTLDDLKQQLDALQKQVAELEQRQRIAQEKQAEAVQTAVTAGATKGSFRLPGSNTSVTVGGYVKLDAVFSNPSAGVGGTAD